MTNQTEPNTMNRSRAVFSTHDFDLIRTAVRDYAVNCEDPGKSVAYANLLHRLGRLG